MYIRGGAGRQYKHMGIENRLVVFWALHTKGCKTASCIRFANACKTAAARLGVVRTTFRTLCSVYGFKQNICTIPHFPISIFDCFNPSLVIINFTEIIQINNISLGWKKYDLKMHFYVQIKVWNLLNIISAWVVFYP